MSEMISEVCVNCDLCIEECPNLAIFPSSSGQDIVFIDPKKCTECTGLYSTQQCALVCPVGACVLDPNNVETEVVLLQRAKDIHGADTVEDNAPSRFKKD